MYMHVHAIFACLIRFWERLRVAFGQRAAALGPGCNHQALVMVVDRGMGALHFRDHRESVLQKPTVIQTDHGNLGQT